MSAVTNDYDEEITNGSGLYEILSDFLGECSDSDLVNVFNDVFKGKQAEFTGEEDDDGCEVIKITYKGVD